jgi:hypothetical protein
MMEDIKERTRLRFQIALAQAMGVLRGEEEKACDLACDGTDGTDASASCREICTK